jgi:hypothetical protein
MHPGVSESIILMAINEHRRRQLLADVGGDSVWQGPPPPRRRPWAWLRSVARRDPGPVSETGEATRATLAGAHPGLRS